MSEEGYNATVTQIGNHGNYMITCNHGNYKAIMLLLWPYGYHMVMMVTTVTIYGAFKFMATMVTTYPT